MSGGTECDGWHVRRAAIHRAPTHLLLLYAQPHPAQLTGQRASRSPAGSWVLQLLVWLSTPQLCLLW